MTQYVHLVIALAIYLNIYLILVTRLGYLQQTIKEDYTWAFYIQQQTHLEVSNVDGKNAMRQLVICRFNTMHTSKG